MNELRPVAEKQKTLTANERAVVLTLARGGTIEQAAQAAGVTVRTVYNYRARPHVLAGLRTAEADQLRELARKLTSASDAALDLLTSTVEDASVSIGQRIRAAIAVLDHRAKFYELVSVDDRLADIERRIVELTSHDQNQRKPSPNGH